MSTLRSVDRLASMLRYFLKRLGGAIPTLFIIVTLVFLSSRDRARRTLRPGAIAAAGDPGESASAPTGSISRCWVQYARYLRALAARGLRTLVPLQGFHASPSSSHKACRSRVEIGPSRSRSRCRSGIPLGMLAALHRHSADGLSSPCRSPCSASRCRSFVVLPLLALLFGIALHWLPVAGWEPGSIRLSGVAGHRADVAAARLHRATDAREHARDAEQPVHPHRLLEGTAAAHGHRCAMRCGRRWCRWRAIWRRRSPRS